MLVNTKKMKNAVVRTRSGVKLGRLASLDLEAETGRLYALRVKIGGMVPGLMDQEALVSWQQVLSMDEKEIVVADTFVSEGEMWIRKRFASPPPAQS